ncbi:TPM domain-containing protein (plasmid) [Lactococcus garvieae]|uniref:TPM domain-containing protein n=1 Tax=Lactococcus garvieae TaxID=1363 RepID=UPI0030D4F528
MRNKTNTAKWHVNKLKWLKTVITLSFIIITPFFFKDHVAQASTENYVYQSDDAKVLSPEEVDELNTQLIQFSESTDKETNEKINSQFAVYVTDSLNGSSIEDYSQNVFNTKQIGDKEHNKGVLLVLAINDHKYRVQLGDGWKGTALTQSSIKSYAFGGSLTSMLKAENYSGAIQQIVQRTIGIAGQDVSLVQPLQSYSKSYSSEKDKEIQFDVASFISTTTKTFVSLTALIFSIIILFFVIRNFATYSRESSYISSMSGKEVSDFTPDISYSKKQILERTTEAIHLLSLEFAFDEDLENLPFTIQEVAEKFSESHYEEITEDNLQQFILELVQDQEKLQMAAVREKTIKKLMHNRLIKEKNLPVSYYELIRAFTKTKLEATEENIDIFIDNFLKNYSLLKESDESLKPATHALKLTEKKPTTVFGDDIFKQLVLLNLLSTPYRSEYSNSEVPTTGPSSSHSSSSSSSSSSSYSSTLSDFSGGGGFSSGGGASGGW